MRYEMGKLRERLGVVFSIQSRAESRESLDGMVGFLPFLERLY